MALENIYEFNRICNVVKTSSKEAKVITGTAFGKF